MPNNGLGHGVLRHLSADTSTVDALAALAEPEIVFNYLGRISENSNSLLDLESTSVGQARFPGDSRRYLIEINSMVRNDKLEIIWVYCPQIHSVTTIKTLSTELIINLEALINHCLSPEAGGFSPSDFPSAFIDQSELDDLLADLED